MVPSPTRGPGLPPPRRRSVGFLDVDGRRWACFLVTFRTGLSVWRGHFAFRPCDGGGVEELRTADIFVEASEAEVENKARGMGRPLLSGLLSSALHVQQRERTGGASRPMDPEGSTDDGADRRKGELPGVGPEAPSRGLPPSLADPIRALLARDAFEWADGSPPPVPREPDPPETPFGSEEAAPGVDEARLRSLYLSYRLDQVAHLVALTPTEAFEDAVLQILREARVDFGTRDRTQWALLVVERLERLLPLPPFETWRDDYLADPSVYRIYAHRLHREGVLDD